jgi:hypothetical protein
VLRVGGYWSAERLRDPRPRLRRYDTFLCWWWQHTSSADGDRPYVIFICQDEDQRDRFLNAADRELTASSGTRPRPLTRGSTRGASVWSSPASSTCTSGGWRPGASRASRPTTRGAMALAQTYGGSGCLAIASDASGPRSHAWTLDTRDDELSEVNGGAWSGRGLAASLGLAVGVAAAETRPFMGLRNSARMWVVGGARLSVLRLWDGSASVVVGTTPDVLTCCPRGQVLLAPSDPRSLRAALDCRPAQPTTPPARPWRTRTKRARPDRQHCERGHRRGPRPLRGRAGRRTVSTGLIWARGCARLAGHDRLRAPARRSRRFGPPSDSRSALAGWPSRSP